MAVVVIVTAAPGRTARDSPGSGRDCLSGAAERASADLKDIVMVGKRTKTVKLTDCLSTT